MQRALQLARRGLGKTSPNPATGAVLVKNGRIIGEGWHKRAGGPHAEIVAFRGCGSGLPAATGRDKNVAPTMAKGATLYSTLEPCCTWGKTPPCTDAIIAAGVKRVVYAATDPNPKHSGRGAKVLRRAGIRVDIGLLADEATRMNAAFNKWITTGLPLVIAKAAMSADGKIATHAGDSKWITSEAARREAHKLRARVDAVMVGANTVIRDNPQLTVRHGVRGKQPLRVVVDARGRCPRSAKLFTNAHRRRTVVLTTNRSSRRWRRNLALLGIDVMTTRGKNGMVNLRQGLRSLGRMNVTSVLVEGGGELLGSLFDARLVDRVAFFYAPRMIGGRAAVSAIGGLGAAKVTQAVRLRECRWRKIGQSEMLLEAEVIR